MKLKNNGIWYIVYTSPNYIKIIVNGIYYEQYESKFNIPMPISRTVVHPHYVKSIYKLNEDEQELIFKQMVGEVVEDCI